MADKPIGALPTAENVADDDSFILEQNSTAKRLTGKTLVSFLLNRLNGRGGIKSIVKVTSAGLADLYDINYADGTSQRITITNGRGITGIDKVSTNGNADTYAIRYNDGTSTQFTVLNGTNGKDGEDAYVWVRYASLQPSNANPSFGEVPDRWMGVYSGPDATAPKEWSAYNWYDTKGERGLSIYRVNGTNKPSNRYSFEDLDLPEDYTPKVGDLTITTDGFLAIVDQVFEDSKQVDIKSTDISLNAGYEIVIYGVSDGDAVRSAAMSGKPVYCLLEDLYYLPMMDCREDANIAVFGGCYNNKIITCDFTYGGWTVKAETIGSGLSAQITKVVDQNSTDNQIPTAKAVYDFGLGVSGGMSDSAKKLLITILRNAVYSTDQSANITALENALAGGEEEPDEPDVPDVPVVTTYTISKELVNVTSNNAATSVNENASYTATLTADEGYTLDSVTVTMGGVDVTADVYADGVISIPSVTGNVEIIASAIAEEKPAELPIDGLMGYWDLRNPEEVVAKNWHWAYPSNEGSGGLYASAVGGSMGSASLPTFNEYGTANGFKLMRDSETYPANVDFGTEFTFIILTHGAAATSSNGDYSNGVVGSNIAPHWEFGTNYYKVDGTSVATGTMGSGNMDSVADYNILVKRVNGLDLKIIMDTSEYSFNGADYADFDHWNPYVNIVTLHGNGTTVAVAMYDRALTDVEIEEVRAFMKTLEVA